MSRVGIKRVLNRGSNFTKPIIMPPIEGTYPNRGTRRTLSYKMGVLEGNEEVRMLIRINAKVAWEKYKGEAMVNIWGRAKIVNDIIWSWNVVGVRSGMEKRGDGGVSTGN